MTSAYWRHAACVSVLAGVLLFQPVLIASHVYTVTLSGARASARPDHSGWIISFDAAGDLRGLLTIDLTDDGTAVRGTWTFAAAYMQDLNPDGTVNLHPEHVDGSTDDDTADALNRPLSRAVRDGVVTGAASDVVLATDPHTGQRTLQFAQLSIEGGTRTFAGATGVGSIATTSLSDGTTVTVFTITL
jgi:hypothetical protein